MCSFIEDYNFEDHPAKKIYSSEYEYVICVYPEGCTIKLNVEGLYYRIDSYLTMSRATIKLVKIS